MADYIVGLTGGIGCGKTTIANMFGELGIDIVDADIVARDIVAPGSPALSTIIKHFGEQYQDQQGQLNRALLRTRVFNHPADKSWLNQLLHPLIRNTMLAQLDAAKSAYCLLVAPLLFENHLEKLVNRVLVVDINEDLQIARTLKRDASSAQEIRLIINSQVSRQQRQQKADDIIDNSSVDLGLSKIIVQQLHQKYLTSSKAVNRN
jgi:dephospho-CoA kinase